MALLAFLAPIIGGHLPSDVWPLESGYTATVRSIFRGVELATLQHALLALLVVGAFGYLVLKRKIVQVPHVWISGPLATFMLLLLGSVFLSNYRWISEISLAEWVVYAISLVAAVAGLGRRGGPLAVLRGLSAGTGVIALLGLIEYGQVRVDDPGWRIFAGWNNPNAVAGMFVIGILISLGLLATSKMGAWAIVSGASAALGGLALVLTGSKGGTVAITIGIVVFIALLLAWKRSRDVVKVVACLGLAAAMVFAVQLTNPKGAGSGLRVASGGETQEQSAGFRIQLWKGALALIKENPVGRGLNTYSFYSGKPGTNTITGLTHSTWLQLAVEAGVLAPLSLFALLLAWLAHTFRSARSLPAEQNVLRAAVVAAVTATVAHGFIESNLYFFGIGLTFFLLLGVGIQLSADAGAPEFVAPPMRAAAILFAGLCLGQLLFAGFVAKLQANVRAHLLSKEFDEAREGAASLRGLAPFDGETWYRSGDLAASPEERVRYYAKAAEVAPSPRYFRRLAHFQAEAGSLADAQRSLNRALELDPFNLASLLQLMEIQDRLGITEEAKETATKLISMETSPLFKVRALPQLIPTETYKARIYLASKDPARTDLLREAVEGFQLYARTTLPYARALASQGGDSAVGVSPQEAETKTRAGLDAAKGLQLRYRAKGDAAGAEWAAKAISEFEVALAASGTAQQPASQ